MTALYVLGAAYAVDTVVNVTGSHLSVFCFCFQALTLWAFLVSFSHLNQIVQHHLSPQFPNTTDTVHFSEY